MELHEESLRLMRACFIAECFMRGANNNEASEYFDQRAIKEGWTQQNETKL